MAARTLLVGSLAEARHALQLTTDTTSKITTERLSIHVLLLYEGRRWLRLVMT